MSADQNPDKPTWYIADQKSGAPAGPYPEREIVDRLRSGKLQLDSHVFSMEFEEDRWKRVFEVAGLLEAVAEPQPIFAPPKRYRRPGGHRGTPAMRAGAEGQFGAENSYRRHPRAPFETQVIVHNHREYYRGVCVDISEKGLFFKLELKRGETAPTFEKGEEVVVTVRSAHGVETFSAPSVILRSAKSGETPAFGVYFLRLHPQARRQIAGYVIRKLLQEDEATAGEARAG